MTRDKKGRYSKGSAVTTLLGIIVLVAVVVVLFINLKTHNEYTYINTATTTASTHATATTTDPLAAIKARENFQKRVQNEAQQVYLSEQITDRKAQIEKLKADQAGLEKQLEKTRTEELSFQ